MSAFCSLSPPCKDKFEASSYSKVALAPMIMVCGRQTSRWHFFMVLRWLWLAVILAHFCLAQNVCSIIKIKWIQVLVLFERVTHTYCMLNMYKQQHLVYRCPLIQGNQLCPELGDLGHCIVLNSRQLVFDQELVLPINWQRSCVLRACVCACTW